MAEDTYERKDNRSVCDIYGHSYKEISSSKKYWTEEEESLVAGGVEYGEGSHDLGTPVYKTFKVHYSGDLVTYRCSRNGCGDEVTRLENRCRE